MEQNDRSDVRENWRGGFESRKVNISGTKKERDEGEHRITKSQIDKDWHEGQGEKERGNRGEERIREETRLMKANKLSLSF